MYKKTYTLRLMNLKENLEITKDTRAFMSPETAMRALEKPRLKRAWGAKAGDLEGLRGHVQVQILDDAGTVVTRLAYLAAVTYYVVQLPSGRQIGRASFVRSEMDWFPVAEALSQRLASGELDGELPEKPEDTDEAEPAAATGGVDEALVLASR